MLSSLWEGTEWIVGRSTESVGLMYYADRGIVDSHQKYYSWNTLFFADTWHVWVRESVGPQNALGRIGGLLSTLSYIEYHYVHLLIYVQFASGRGTVKITWG